MSLDASTHIKYGLGQDEERSGKRDAYSSKQVFSHDVPLQGRKVQDETDILENVSWIDDESPSSIPEHGKTPAPNSFSQFLNNFQTTRIDQRDRAGERGSHLRTQNELFLLESCGRRSFGRISDCFRDRDRRTEERILSFRGERANRIGAHGSIGRHARQKYQEMNSVLIFYGSICLRSTNVHAIRKSSRKNYFWESWKENQQGWRNRKDVYGSILSTSLYSIIFAGISRTWETVTWNEKSGSNGWRRNSTKKEKSTWISKAFVLVLN